MPSVASPGEQSRSRRGRRPVRYAADDLFDAEAEGALCDLALRGGDAWNDALAVGVDEWSFFRPVNAETWRAMRRARDAGQAGLLGHIPTAELLEQVDGLHLKPVDTARAEILRAIEGRPRAQLGSGRLWAVQVQGLALLRKREEAAWHARTTPGRLAFAKEAEAVTELAAFVAHGAPGAEWEPPPPAPAPATIVPLDATDDDHSASALLPGTVRVPSYSGHWRAGGGWLWRVPRGENGLEPHAVTPCPIVRRRITWRDHAGHEASRSYALELDGVEFVLRDSDLREPDAWQTAPVPVSPDPRVLVLLATAIRLAAEAEECEQVDGAPQWQGGRLCLPPSGYGPAGYGDTTGTEWAARDAWRAVGALAAGNPKVAVVIGAAFAGPAIAELGRPAWILHMVGDAGRGKSSTCEVAAAMLGGPEVIGGFDVTSIGLARHFGELSCLPKVLDELGENGLTPEALKALIFRLTGGRGRLVAKRAGGTQQGLAWRSVMISSGNEGLMRVSNNVGLPRRVVEVPTPIIRDKVDATALVTMAQSARGWPLRWLATDPELLGQIRDETAAVDVELGAEVGGTLGSVAEHLALAVAGARVFGRLVGAPGLGEAALLASRELHEEAEAELAERGVSQGPELGEAVLEALVRRPWAFIGQQEDAGGREIEGYRLPDGRLLVLTSALRRIATERGIGDYVPAVRALARAGSVERPADARSRLTAKVRARDSYARGYMFTAQFTRDDDAPPGSMSGTVVPTSPPVVPTLCPPGHEAPTSLFPPVPTVPTEIRSPSPNSEIADLERALGELPASSPARARIVAAGLAGLTWQVKPTLTDAQQEQAWAWLVEELNGEEVPAGGSSQDRGAESNGTPTRLPPDVPGAESRTPGRQDEGTRGSSPARPRGAGTRRRGASGFYGLCSTDGERMVTAHGTTGLPSTGADLGHLAEAARALVPPGAHTELVCYVHEAAMGPLGLPARAPATPEGEEHPYPAASSAAGRHRLRYYGDSGGVTIEGTPRVHLLFAGWSRILDGTSSAEELLAAAELYRQTMGLALAFSPAATVRQIVKTSPALAGLPAEEPPGVDGWRVSSFAAQHTWTSGEALDAGAWIQLMDRRGSFLAVWNADLPAGPWEEAGRADVEGKLPAGYYLLDLAELRAELATRRLPDPFHRHGEQEHRAWLTAPLAQLAGELSLDVCGAVLNAERRILAGTTKRFLGHAYDVQRAAIATLGDDGSPAALAALGAVKAGYAQATGWLEFDGLSGDVLYRPAWRHTIIDRHVANTGRALLKARPVAWGDVDTAAFVVPSPGELPEGLPVRPGRLGDWKPKGRPMPWAKAQEALGRGGMRAVENVRVDDDPGH